MSKNVFMVELNIMCNQEQTDNLVDFLFPFPCLFCAALYALRYVYTQEASIIYISS